jgi:hypothetical protein
MLAEVSRNANSPYIGRRAPWRGYKRNCDQQLLMRPFHYSRGNFKLMRSTTCTISIGLTARTEGEAADTAAEVTASAEEAMDTVTTVNPLPFVDQDYEETTVEIDGAIKGPARGDAMSVDDQDAGRSTIPGKNENDLSITSASNTTSRRAEQPRHRTSKCLSATLKAQRK